MAHFLLSLPQIREGGIPQAEADRTHQSGLSPRDTGTKPTPSSEKCPLHRAWGKSPQGCWPLLLFFILLLLTNITNNGGDFTDLMSTY